MFRTREEECNLISRRQDENKNPARICAISEKQGHGEGRVSGQNIKDMHPGAPMLTGGRTDSLGD